MTELKADGLSYEKAVEQTAGEIERLLKTPPAAARSMTGHLAKATGKMVRARALLACALRPDGLIEPDAVKAAAAVELLHLATLVHDDILDDADKRRGIQTLHKKFGVKNAVLTGDYLFCTALEFVSGATLPQSSPETMERVLPRYLSEVCLGEMRQSQNGGNLSLTERAYFKTIRGKTAALFEACFYAGYLFSGEGETFKEQYKAIGGELGLIFQLADDCADYEATRKIAKKPVLSDYSRGVITLPLIYALKKDKALLQKLREGLSAETLKAVVEAAGGLNYARDKALSLYKKALRRIDALEVLEEKKELLMSLLRGAAGF